MRTWISGRLPIDTLLAFAFGVVFLLITILLEVVLGRDEASPIIHVTLALAAMGIGAGIPGLLNFTASTGKGLAIKGSGALVCFLVVYLVNPLSSQPNSAPDIEQLTVEPSRIIPGQVVTIAWRARNADIVRLQPLNKEWQNDQSVSASVTTRPVTNTTYVLELVVKGTPVATREATVVVSLPVCTARLEQVIVRTGPGERFPEATRLNNRVRLAPIDYSTREYQPDGRIIQSEWLHMRWDGENGEGWAPAADLDCPPGIVDVLPTASVMPHTPTVTPSIATPTPMPAPGALLCDASKVISDSGLDEIWIEDFADQGQINTQWKMDPNQPWRFKLRADGAPCGAGLSIIGQGSLARELPAGSRPTYIAYSVKPQDDAGKRGVQDTTRGELVLYTGSCENGTELLATAFQGEWFRTAPTFGASAGYRTSVTPDQWHMVELTFDWVNLEYDMLIDSQRIQRHIPFMIGGVTLPVGCVKLRNTDNSVSEWDTMIVAGSRGVPPLTPTPDARPAAPALMWRIHSEETRVSRTEYYPGTDTAYCVPQGYQLDTSRNPLGYDLKVYTRFAAVNVFPAEVGSKCVGYVAQSPLLRPPEKVSATSPGYRLQINLSPGSDAVLGPAVADGVFLLYARLATGGSEPSSDSAAIVTETPPAPKQVSLSSVDWSSLLKLNTSYDEGTDGKPADGTADSYLTYPGTYNITFAADNHAVIRYPYKCRKRHKTFLFGQEIATKDSQHPGEIEAQAEIVSGNRLLVQVRPIGSREGRCANSIISHLQNLSGRVVEAPSAR